MCHHYDYLKDYIVELETVPPINTEKFEIFWLHYPRKAGKKMALKAWLKIKMDDELFTKIMEALGRHKKTAQWTDAGGRFIPHPTTWLNQERWDDVLDSVSRIDTNNYNEVRKETIEILK